MCLTKISLQTSVSQPLLFLRTLLYYEEQCLTYFYSILRWKMFPEFQKKPCTVGYFNFVFTKMIPQKILICSKAFIKLQFYSLSNCVPICEQLKVSLIWNYYFPINWGFSLSLHLPGKWNIPLKCIKLHLLVHPAALKGRW